MSEPRLAALTERLLRAGIAPRHARRAVLELREHHADVVDELRAAGHPPAQIAARYRLARMHHHSGDAAAVSVLVARASGVRVPLAQLSRRHALLPRRASHSGARGGGPPGGIRAERGARCDRLAGRSRGRGVPRVAQDEERRRKAKAFGPPAARAMFAPAPRRKPGLAWNYARAHRVEALAGGVTVFNLNDHCSIALLWVVPFFGCKLGKIPTRGDLFDHMHDAPQSGD